MSATELALVRQVDEAAVLQHLNLDPRNPATQATLLICQRYNLDPVLKHVVLISGRPYVTRDGYLHLAHASGQLDGIEIVDEGEDDNHWWARCSVYRKDMARPFTYRGRYPKATAGHMTKYGPEMAIKCAEVMTLRRAFDVGGVGAADEQWDDYSPLAEPATPEQVDAIHEALAGLEPDETEVVKAWWKEQRFPSLKSGRLSMHEAVAILDHLDGLTVTEGEVVDEEDSATRPGVDHPEAPEGPTGGEAQEGEGVGEAADASIDRPTPGASQPPAEDGEPINQLQSRKLHALLRSVRQATGPQRHVVLSELVGREIASASDLTAAEARHCIDVLTAEEAQQ